MRSRSRRHALAQEGVRAAELGIAFVAPDEIRALKAQHLGIDEATDVLSFPIDGRRRACPTAFRGRSATSFICPQVVGDEWRWPLVHGILHLLGFDHGDAMEQREREILEAAG